ncbi:hypothetical protein BDP55DRAFT_739169 [Colletotrichum godetiae]|uniref:Uncharacterized protein n=1 Tax=Colletotrichum godetiae TaxID=1209918 RepID=A0AAJ0A5A8_9PEZI|nr:uncharacterized protein BDP55DRAFT_739169 [Colletotrichum godetiae]KAK1656766.1 hypothetical protein BDP55DRAFT_739169 [Colletotrichum godetiae]
MDAKSAIIHATFVSFPILRRSRSYAVPDPTPFPILRRSRSCALTKSAWLQNLHGCKLYITASSAIQTTYDMESWRLLSVATLEIHEESRPGTMSIALCVKKRDFDTLRLDGEDSLREDRDEVIKVLATRAVQRFGKDPVRSDPLLRSLARMALPLRPMHRCRVLLEAALYYAQRLTGETEEEEWQKLCSVQLATFQSSDAIPRAEPRKRRREEDFASRERSKKRRGEIAQPLAAKMPDVQAIPNFIGTFLFVGLTRSSVRQKDINVAMTAAFEMHFAPQAFQDFTLLLTIDKDTGEILREALSWPLDKLEIYLGRWLTDAVRAAADSDVRFLYPHDNNEDMILELGLGFQHGREMSHAVFPMR